MAKSRINSTAFLMLFCFSLTTIARSANCPRPVQGIIRPLFDKALFSGSVIASRNGKQLIHCDYGFADRRFQVPVTEQTRFNVASVSKSFTAVAILKLRDSHKLSLDDMVTRYIPSFPYADIHIRQLLTHSSGLGHPVFFPDFYERARKSYTLKEAVELLQSYPLAAQPGTRHIYSDLNYIVLARIVEIVSGQDLQSFLVRQIAQPLGLETVGTHGPRDEIVPKLAFGYQPVGLNEWEESRHFNYSIEAGAAAMYMSCRDLARWTAVLGKHEGLSREMIADLFGSEAQKGILSTDEVFGHRTLVLSGWDNIGFAAESLYLPDADLTVAVTANENNSGVASFLARQILASLLKQHGAILRFSADPTDVQQYSGTYRFGDDFYVPGATMELIVSQGSLFEKQRGPDRLMGLIPLKDNQFLHRSSFQIVTFVRSDQNISTMQFGPFRAMKTKAEISGAH